MPWSHQRFAAEAKSTGDKKVQAKAVPMDFSKLNYDIQWNALESELAGLDIGVLGEYAPYACAASYFRRDGT